MHRVFLFLAFVCVVTIFPTGAVRAVELPGAATKTISISISPENPLPYHTITIRPESTLLDLATQTVQIFVNGVEIKKGSGSISAATTLGAPGTTTNIKVVATSASGVVSTTTATLRPVDVALIIEPGTSTHPFYEGGQLVAPESPIRIVAITDFRNAAGVPIPSSSLIYTWKFGDRILQSDSGIGRSVLSVISPVKYRDAVVSLTVTSPDSSLVGGAEILVSPSDPVVLFYQHDPLLGILFNNAISSSFSMTGAEATFRAISYYLETTPLYTWTLNSAESGSGSDLTVRANGSGNGTALLGVTAKDAAGKSASALLSVLFGNKASSGIFGL